MIDDASGGTFRRSFSSFCLGGREAGSAPPQSGGVTACLPRRRAEAFRRRADTPAPPRRGTSGPALPPRVARRRMLDLPGAEFVFEQPGERLHPALLSKAPSFVALSSRGLAPPRGGGPEADGPAAPRAGGLPAAPLHLDIRVRYTSCPGWRLDVRPESARRRRPAAGV